MTTQPQMPAELSPKRSLGHLWKVTVQHRYGQTDAIDVDLKVWIGCTCGWWPSPNYPSEEAAVAAFYQYHRPGDLPVQVPRGSLFDGDDTGGRGAAEDADINARIGEP